MQLSAVGVRYGRRAPWVLREVSLNLPAASLVEVTGRNGAGKSSLLRVLAGVLPPAAGVVIGLYATNRGSRPRIGVAVGVCQSTPQCSSRRSL